MGAIRYYICPHIEHCEAFRIARQKYNLQGQDVIALWDYGNRVSYSCAALNICCHTLAERDSVFANAKKSGIGDKEEPSVVANACLELELLNNQLKIMELPKGK